MWNFNDNNGSNSFIWHILNTIWAIFKILQAEIHWSDTFLPLFFSRHLRLCSANHEINPPKWLKMAERSAIWSPWSKRFACQTKWRASELKHYAIPIPALFSRPRIKKSYNFDRKRWNLMIVQRDNSLERGEIREIKYIKERFRKKINAHYQLFEAPELLWAAAAVHTAVFVDAGHDDWWWSGIRTHLSLSLHLSMTLTDVYHLNFIRHVVVAYHWIIILYVRASYLIRARRSSNNWQPDWAHWPSTAKLPHRHGKLTRRRNYRRT